MKRTKYKSTSLVYKYKHNNIIRAIIHTNNSTTMLASSAKKTMKIHKLLKKNLILQICKRNRPTLMALVHQVGDQVKSFKCIMAEKVRTSPTIQKTT